jgi:hypothetical protein
VRTTQSERLQIGDAPGREGQPLDTDSAGLAAHDVRGGLEVVHLDAHLREKRQLEIGLDEGATCTGVAQPSGADGKRPTHEPHVEPDRHSLAPAVFHGTSDA